MEVTIHAIQRRGQAGVELYLCASCHVTGWLTFIISFSQLSRNLVIALADTVCQLLESGSLWLFTCLKPKVQFPEQACIYFWPSLLSISWPSNSVGTFWDTKRSKGYFPLIAHFTAISVSEHSWYKLLNGELETNWEVLGKKIGHDVIVVLEGTEGNHENPQLCVGVPVEIRYKPLPYRKQIDQIQ